MQDFAELHLGFMKQYTQGAKMDHSYEIILLYIFGEHQIFNFSPFLS